MPLFHRRSTGVRAAYFSKKGPFVWLMSAIMIGLTVLAIREIRAGHESIFAFFVLLAAAIFAWIALSTRYEIHEDDLIIRSGPQRWTIPFESIVEIAVAARWTPGPALALQRLQINYVHPKGTLASIVVSPADRDAFIEALREAVARARRDHGDPPPWDGTHQTFRGHPQADKKIEL